MNERRMELLAPAGDESALRAAVQNGADAVYLGAGSFNARRNAGNFDGRALDDAVAYCHARGVRVHVTLNTLVRQDEFDALLEAARAVNESGADAVIVQDLGVAAALRQIAPRLELHASTQMAVHNRQGVAFLKAQGFDRVVLARELTFEEMARCADEGIEIETFVHGALCAACSGQCLMSSMVGGRSGNRGLCAQPCRLPWRLGDRAGHLLSTRDLCAIDELVRLREAGVSSLKIEGRLKRAEYVAVTVAAYRRALDALYEKKPFDSGAARDELRQMFNRGGFTRGYGPGAAESELMYPERPNHVGVRVGESGKNGEVVLAATVSGADILALRRKGSEDIPVSLSGLAGERARCAAARRGDGLWRLVSEEQMKRARQSFDGEHWQIPVSALAVLKVGQPAALTVWDGEHAATAEGPVIEAATGRGFDAERTRVQLSKTGGTCYAVTGVALHADADAHCPASLLNALRRNALEALEAQRTRVRRQSLTFETPALPREAVDAPLLMAQSADPTQLLAALKAGADVAVFAPRDIRPASLAAVDLKPLAAAGRLALALPAVAADEALDGLNAWALENRVCFEMTFLSNIGQFALEWPGTWAGDYMLNIGNNAAAKQLCDWGVKRYTPSVELNAGQIARLGGCIDLIVWGRVPLMQLRHCPLRAAQNMQGRHAQCRHCDTCAAAERLDGRVMTDRKGVAFPLRRLAQPGGCVVQLLNSAPIMPLRRLERLPASAGWRLLLDAGEPVEVIVDLYRAALDGADFRSMPQWRTVEDMDTTTGHFFRGVE